MSPEVKDFEVAFYLFLFLFSLSIPPPSLLDKQLDDVSNERCRICMSVGDTGSIDGMARWGARGRGKANCDCGCERDQIQKIRVGSPSSRSHSGSCRRCGACLDQDRKEKDQLESSIATEKMTRLLGCIVASLV